MSIVIVVSASTEDVSLTAVRQHITPITPNQTPLYAGPKHSPLPAQPGWPCPPVPVCPAPRPGSLHQHLSAAPLHSCRRGSPTCAGHKAASQCASRSVCSTHTARDGGAAAGSDDATAAAETALPPSCPTEAHCCACCDACTPSPAAALGNTPPLTTSTPLPSAPNPPLDQSEHRLNPTGPLHPAPPTPLDESPGLV